MDKCVEFENNSWFEFGKFMWRKHCSIFQDHLKYLHTDIVKPFRVGICRYAKRVQDVHNLAKHLPPPSINCDSFEAANCKVRDKEFSVREIRFSIKDLLPLSIQDELEDI